MDLANYFPREVWIKILQYVPLQDRVRNVQWVSKEFYRLCNDIFLMTTLNFEGCIFMPDVLCLSLLRKARAYVQYLSFRNCVWFASSMFAKFPKLNRLVSLDLLGCKLSGSNIHALLCNAHSIQNLSLTMTIADVQTFCECSPRPALNIQVLHVEFLISHSLAVYYITYPRHFHLAHFVRACCQNAPCSLSATTYETFVNAESYLGFQNLFQSGKIAINTEFLYIKFAQSLTSKGKISELLRNVGLHGFSSNANVLDKTRLISLPYPMVPQNNNTPCHCRGIHFPSSLPVLEYLALCPYLPQAGVQCYSAVAEGILMECDLPKLCYLDMGRYAEPGFTVPLKLYDRLGSFTNLVELNVASISFHLFMLLDAIKGLKHLTGLALRINNTIKARLQSNDTATSTRGRISRVARQNTAFFIELVDYFPNLIKLELTCCRTFQQAINASVLRPLVTLIKLKVLMLDKIVISDIALLGQLFHDCTSIRSLTVTGIGVAGFCEYKKFSTYLRCMPNLTHLDIGHAYLEPESIFLDMYPISKLQRLVIRFDSYLMTSYLEQFLKSVFFNCKELCTCILVVTAQNEVAKTIISRVKRDLKAMKRNVVIAHGLEHNNLGCEAQSFLCRTRSSVATYDPYKFLLQV